MASGIVEDLKCTDYNSPVSTAFTKSFTASAATVTTATQADYPSIPAGYHGVFAGRSIDAAALLIVSFNPNASESETLMNTRNVASSAQNNKNCNFYNSLLSSDCIQDERNL